MKISVVIPLYNKAAHIKRAVDSVLAQTVTDWELIVVDDGSTDGGGDIVKQYTDPRIRYIRQENQGVSVARNNGINAAQAELVAFLDADDEWMPQFLETILRLREKFPQAGLYCTAYSTVEPDGTRTTLKFKAIPPSPWEGIIPDYFESVLSYSPVSASSAAIPKPIFYQTGLFPEGVSMGEDLDTWLRIALKFPIVFSNTRQVTYYRNASNRTGSQHVPRAKNFILELLREEIMQSKTPPALKIKLRQYHDSMLSAYIRTSLWNDDHFTARQFTRQYQTHGKVWLIHFLLAFLPWNSGKAMLKINKLYHAKQAPQKT